MTHSPFVGDVLIWRKSAWVVVTVDRHLIGVVREGGLGPFKVVDILPERELCDTEIVSKSIPIPHVIRRG